METAIDAVVVYPDRALVTRRGRAGIQAGRREFVLDDLPNTLLPESVRIRARGTVAMRLVATDVGREFKTTPVEAKPAQLVVEIEGFEDRDAVLGRRLAAVSTRRQFLQELATQGGAQIARGLALGRSGIEAGAALAGFLAEQLSSLDEEVGAIEPERRALQKELAAARSRLKQFQHRSPVERSRITVTLDAEGDGEAELEVRYQVLNASWAPLYDLRFSEGTGTPRLELACLAEVVQQTGEPWEAVQLTLSTARPALGAGLPELTPWYLHQYVPVVAAEMAAMRSQAPGSRVFAAPTAAPADMAAGAAGMDFASDDAVVEAVHVEAGVETSGAAITFLVSGRAGIPNDGSPHKVALAGWDLPARFDLVAAPKLVAHTFRRARATNPGPALLLAGRAQVFHEDEFVGSTHLKAAAPGEELELYLGVEDRVRITRKLVEGAVDRRFLSDQRRLSYAYEIKVQNLRDRREQVVVQDQLPVSRHEQIAVRRQDVRPAPAEETKLGRLRWDLTLEPQQEQTIRVAFSIEHPRAFTVVGLPPLTTEAG